MPALTGLRLIAALMYFLTTPFRIWKALPLESNAPNIVDYILFVLSDFIITYNYLEKFESTPYKNNLSYFTSRLARIYALYALCIIYTWINSDATPSTSVSGGCSSME